MEVKPMASNDLNVDNPIGLDGMEFIEYTSPEPEALQKLFESMGFEKVGTHKTKNVDLFKQNDIHFILNKEPETFAKIFSESHGPSICATGFRVVDAKKAFDEAVKRGAKPCPEDSKSHSFPAIYGIGDSVIYFVDGYKNDSVYKGDFDLSNDNVPTGFGLNVIDHMTNNVPLGEMQKWCDFYTDIFNFKETRFFDIKGEKTGLISKVMSSPCQKITIPINEPSDSKSQIQEYIEEYKGSGIQHVALTTDNIVKTIHDLKEKGIEFLDTPDTYYEKVPDRIRMLEEKLDDLQGLRILVDGDNEGYLLQIFTKNVIGPIFFEIIQRKKHDGFGEGNFQALFDSIEEDQRRRGFLD